MLPDANLEATQRVESNALFPSYRQRRRKPVPPRDCGGRLAFERDRESAVGGDKSLIPMENPPRLRREGMFERYRRIALGGCCRAAVAARADPAEDRQHGGQHEDVEEPPSTLGSSRPLVTSRHEPFLSCNAPAKHECALVRDAHGW
jgi:hypothetical protein